MKILFLINDAPNGTEKAYNALRLAMALQKEQSNIEVLIFLMADAVTCVLPNQTTPFRGQVHFPVPLCFPIVLWSTLFAPSMNLS